MVLNSLFILFSTIQDGCNVKIMVLKPEFIEMSTRITGRLWYSNYNISRLVPLKSKAAKKSVVLKTEEMKLNAIHSPEATRKRLSPVFYVDK